MVVQVIVLAMAFYMLFAPLGLIGRPSGLLLAHAVLALPVVFVIVEAAFRRADRAVELVERLAELGRRKSSASETHEA